jgi:PAS domain S-box-containing protein
MKNRGKFFAALAVFSLALISLMSYLLWSGHRDAIATAETTTRNYAAIYEARLDSTLRRADATLVERVHTIPLAALSPQAVPRYAGKLNATLDSETLSFPELAGLRIFDASGELLYSSAVSDGPHLNVSDRDYFRGARDNPQTDLVVSEVIVTRGTKNNVVVLARALRDGAGRFRGIVTAGIALSYFQELFQAAEIGAQGYLAIHRSDDFSVVARRPLVGAMLNVRLPDGHPTREVLARGEKTSTDTRVFSSDGIERISSMKVLEHYPFFVTAALATDDVLLGWKERSTLVGLLALLLLALAACLVIRLERAERGRGVLAAIVENSNDAIVGRDLGRTIILWNSAAERLFGWTAAEAIGQSISVLIPPDVEESIARARDKVAQGAPAVDLDTVRTAKDGRRIPVSLTRSPIKDQSGTLLGYSLTYRDITDRKRTEELLLRQAQILSQIHDAVIATDLQGIITEWGAGAERLYEYSAEEALGQPVSLIYPADQQRLLSEEIIAPLKRSGWHETEARVRSKSGREFPVHISLNLLKDSNGAAIGMIGLSIEISMRKLAEQALRDANAEMERRVIERTEQVRRLAVEASLAGAKERESIARDLHDDLGQMLYVAKIKLDTLVKALPAAHREDLQEMLALIGDCSRMVRSLTSQLSPPILSELGLGAAIRWLAAEMERNYGLAVECEQNEIPANLTSEQCAILFRAARELLINVAKHAATGNARMSLLASGERLTLSVEDLGQGLTNLQLVQAARTGFGLASLRERITYLGGRMEVRTHPGKGTLVILDLPIAPPRLPSIAVGA